MDPLCQMYQEAATAQRWDELAAIHEKMVRRGYVWRDGTCYPPGTMPGAVAYPEFETSWTAAPVSIGGWETGAVGTPGSCMYTFMMEAKAAGLSYQAALNAWGSLPEGKCTYTSLTTPALETTVTPAPVIQTIPTTPSPVTPAPAVVGDETGGIPSPAPVTPTPEIPTIPTTPSPVTPAPAAASTAPASFFGFMTNEMAANIIVIIAVIAFILLLASGGGKS